MRKCNRHLTKAMEIVKGLIDLADEGERDAEDDSCLALYGIIRDCAYRIRNKVERERDSHIAQGKWDGPEPTGSQ